MEMKGYKLNVIYEKHGKELGMSMNQYVGYLEELVRKDRTKEQELQLQRIEKLESIVQANVNYQISQRAKEFNLEKKLDAIIESNEQLKESNRLLKLSFTKRLKFIDVIEEELSK